MIKSPFAEPTVDVLIIWLLLLMLLSADDAGKSDDVTHEDGSA